MCIERMNNPISVSTFCVGTGLKLVYNHPESNSNAPVVAYYLRYMPMSANAQADPDHFGFYRANENKPVKVHNKEQNIKIKRRKANKPPEGGIFIYSRKTGYSCKHYYK